jgi:hypothetical protein
MLDGVAEMFMRTVRHKARDSAIEAHERVCGRKLIPRRWKESYYSPGVLPSPPLGRQTSLLRELHSCDLHRDAPDTECIIPIPSILHPNSPSLSNNIIRHETSHTPPSRCFPRYSQNIWWRTIVQTDLQMKYRSTPRHRDVRLVV